MSEPTHESPVLVEGVKLDPGKINGVGKITDIEADALARQLGLRRVGGLKLKKCTELGEYVHNLGTVKLARGRYLISMDRLEILAEKIANMAQAIPDDGPIEKVCALGESLRATEKVLVEISKELISAEQALNAGQPAPGTPQLPPPPQPITLTNVTVMAHQPPSSVEKTIHEVKNVLPPMP